MRLCGIMVPMLTSQVSSSSCVKILESSGYTEYISQIPLEGDGDWVHLQTWGVHFHICSSKYRKISLTLSSRLMAGKLLGMYFFTWLCCLFVTYVASVQDFYCTIFFNYADLILYMLNHSADQLWPFPIVGEITYRERGRETIRHGASEWKWPYFKNDKPNVCVSCSRVTADHFVVRDAPWSGLFLSVSTIGSKTGTECRPISRK